MTYDRLAIAAILTSSLSVGCATGVGKVIKSYGFGEFRPPTKNLTPGTVIYLTRKNPYEGGTVCSAAENLGPIPANELLTSPSTATEIQQKLSKELSVGASYLKEIKADSKFSSVEDVKVKFSNVQIFEITDATAIRHAPYIDKDCKTAIKRRKEAVAVIQKSLQADVAYTVEFSRAANLSVETQEDLVRGLAAKLGGKIGDDGKTSIVGTQLIWGIKPSPSLVASDGEAFTRLLDEKFGKVKK